jgi:putative phosphoesterase
MKIGVISDTHLDSPTPLLKIVADKYFKYVDMVFHAGDIHAPEVLEAFKGKKCYVVAGNRDQTNIKEKFPATELIEVKGFRLGLTHGWGFPFGLEKRAASLFEDIDCLVFGHSHWPVNHYRDGILFFNPGAFTGGIFSLWRKTVGILNVGKDIRGEILRI